MTARTVETYADVIGRFARALAGASWAEAEKIAAALRLAADRLDAARAKETTR